VERRSQKRAEAGLAVQVQGADARGVIFEEQVRAVNVSANGLALLTRRDLSHSATLTVTIAGYGTERPSGGRSDFRAQAMVVYVLSEGDLNRVGLRFIGAALDL
jgi:hypothetical protein